MEKYSITKAKINEKITTNSAQAITGNILNDVLQTMVDSLGADYQFGGLVQPGSTFTAGEQPVVFIATTPGTYTNFGGLVVADGDVALLVWSGTAWSKQIPDIATRTEVSKLGQEIGINSGIVCDGSFVKGERLFTKNDVNIGDILLIERASGSAPYVTFYDNAGVEIVHIVDTKYEYEIPDNFSYALADYGAGGSQQTFKVTNLSQIKYRVTELEKGLNDSTDDIRELKNTIGTNNGVLASGTFVKGYIVFTETDVNVGDEIRIEKSSGPNDIAFVDENNTELAKSSGSLSTVIVPPAFAKAVVDYGETGSQSTFKIINLSQLKYRITELEENNDFVISGDSYGVISAKLQLHSNDIHDVNGWAEIMSIGGVEKQIKFLLKKAPTETYPTAVGVCPVPKYNAGICAGVAFKHAIWQDGCGLGWNTGYIAYTPDYATEKCSLKMIVTFDSIKVNTSGNDVRICWYFGEDNTNIQWTRVTTPLVNEVINTPVGARYFAISTQITDTNASVEFSSAAVRNYSILTPDGWNTNLLLGNDTMALRFSGDVTDPANQDIRLKIDDSAITIYHGTDNSVIASYAKSSYNTAESIYNALSSLENFSMELLDISGVVFDDFIKGDVALVSQYNIEKQDNPGVIVTEWDSFPFYFTTKEKNGTYNFEVGIDYSDNNGKKIQAILNGYPLYSADDFAEDFVNVPLSVYYGNNVSILKQNRNTIGEFYCPIRRMFYVEGMTEGIVNGTGGAAWTCRASIEESFDIMIRNKGHNVGYKEMMDEVLGDYKTSGNQFVFTCDDNGIPLYTSAEIRNMFVKKGIHPATFFILDNTSQIIANLSLIKACLDTDYYGGVHSPYGYSSNINVGRLKYSELADAVQQTFSKFIELFGKQPVVWDFHRDGESYNTVKYIINHGYKFVMGGGYANDYGIISTITKYRIKRFGIRPDAQGQNVRMPDDWLFKKY